MHSRVWSTSEAAPDDNDQISAGAAEIRNHMVDVRERLALDHIFASSTATDGYHTTIHLQGRGDNATALASHMLLFAKTGTAGAIELYVTGSGNQVTQLTSGGGVSFLTGDWLFSSTTGAHTGWTNVSATYANKFIRIGTSGLVTGGVDTHTTPSHTLTVAEMPAHTHYKILAPQSLAAGDGTPQSPQTSESTRTTTDASTGGGGGHTHDAADNVPVYVQTIIFQKD